MTRPPRRRLTALALAAAALLTAGCESMYSVGASVGGGIASAASWAPTFLGPYRPDVHQGNIITKEMVDQLRIGMTREQVRFMLGTPLMTSEFRKDRVDYIYYLNPLKGPVQNRRLTLFFADNKLERFTSDPMPPDAEADALILGAKTKRSTRTSNQPAIPMPDVATPVPGSQSGGLP
jgi:outer membrane protein assembly factor BamE